MDVRFWGPHVWATMDFIAFNYPNEPTDEDKKNIKSFFSSITPLLPCASCRTDFSTLLQKFPIEKHLSSRETLTKWLVEAHNRVNEKLGKPRVNYDNISDKYNAMRGTCETRASVPNSPSQCSLKKNCFSNLFLIIVSLISIVTIIGLTTVWIKHNLNK